MHTAEIGKKGEDLAKKYLLDRQYTIRENNWRFSHLEIDIIAENKDFIVFCEVKTRKSNTVGNPEEFVSAQQQRNIIRAANAYLERNNLDKEARFDIISILQHSSNPDIKHIEGAFSPRW